MKYSCRSLPQKTESVKKLLSNIINKVNAVRADYMSFVFRTDTKKSDYTSLIQDTEMHPVPDDETGIYDKLNILTLRAKYIFVH